MHNFVQYLCQYKIARTVDEALETFKTKLRNLFSNLLRLIKTKLNKIKNCSLRKNIFKAKKC